MCQILVFSSSCAREFYEAPQTSLPVWMNCHTATVQLRQIYFNSQISYYAYPRISAGSFAWLHHALLALPASLLASPCFHAHCPCCQSCLWHLAYGVSLGNGTIVKFALFSQIKYSRIRDQDPGQCTESWSFFLLKTSILLVSLIIFWIWQHLLNSKQGSNEILHFNRLLLRLSAALCIHFFFFF